MFAQGIFPYFRRERNNGKEEASEFNNVLCRRALRFKYFFHPIPIPLKFSVFLLRFSHKYIPVQTHLRYLIYDLQKKSVPTAFSYNSGYPLLRKKEHFLLSWGTCAENALSIQECSTTASASDCREEKEGARENWLFCSFLHKSLAKRSRRSSVQRERELAATPDFFDILFARKNVMSLVPDGGGSDGDLPLTLQAGSTISFASSSGQEVIIINELFSNIVLLLVVDPWPV